MVRKLSQREVQINAQVLDRAAELGNTIEAYKQARREIVGEIVNPKQRSREAHILRTYGLTWEQYLEMLAAQGWKCAICKEPFQNEYIVKVDHCHRHGHVRGLLCNMCNTTLGRFGDDIGLLRRAIIYLAWGEAAAPQRNPL